MNNSYYAAILTLYDKECQIDENAQREYIRFLLDKKVKGFFPAGHQESIQTFPEKRT